MCFLVFPLRVAFKLEIHAPVEVEALRALPVMIGTSPHPQPVFVTMLPVRDPEENMVNFRASIAADDAGVVVLQNGF
jgi:hypothetical protein